MFSVVSTYGHTLMRIPHPVRSAKSSISGSVSSAVREDARSLGAVVFSVPFLFFSLAFSFDFFLLLVLLHARLLRLAAPRHLLHFG